MTSHNTIQAFPEDDLPGGKVLHGAGGAQNTLLLFGHVSKGAVRLKEFQPWNGHGRNGPGRWEHR